MCFHQMQFGGTLKISEIGAKDKNRHLGKNPLFSHDYLFRLKISSSSLCRFCTAPVETIGHFLNLNTCPRFCSTRFQSRVIPHRFNTPIGLIVTDFDEIWWKVRPP